MIDQVQFWTNKKIAVYYIKITRYFMRPRSHNRALPMLD